MTRRVSARGIAVGGMAILAFAAGRFLLSGGAAGQAEGDWTQQALAVQNAFVEVAETAAKAVVTISSEGRIPVGDAFSRFFFGGPSWAEVRGLGSGVIFDKRGYVITNDHVIEILTQKLPVRIEGDKGYVMTDAGAVEIPLEKVPVRVEDGRATLTVGKIASDIKVTLPDGRTFPAKVQGRDRLLDISVLKLEGADAQNLPTATLGDSSKARVGHLMLAIGNPYGGYQYLDSPQPTVTDGIISALDRTFPTDDERRSYGGLIQTSAAVNRGNSGGPLVNIRGEVIGINAAIFSTSQGSEGIGFAIPINRVKARLGQLMAGDKIEYGYIGIVPVEVDPKSAEELGKRLGWKVPRGVVVGGVERGGSADKAGLKEGDIIVKLDDKGIVNSAQLVDMLANTPVGETISVTVVRDGKPIVKKAVVSGRTRDYVPWLWR